jgi:hypothetical protein
VFIKGDGKFCYRGHRWQLANNLTATATIGDSSAEIGYSDITFAYDDTQIFNRATGTASDSAATSLDTSDATSITAYGESARALGTLTVVNVNVLRNTLGWIVANYKDPKLRAEQVQFSRPPASAAATWYPMVLGAAPGVRLTLVRRPQSVGASISQDVIVESVSHSMNVHGAWQATFGLSGAPGSAGSSGYWRIGTDKLGSSGTAVWA